MKYSAYLSILALLMLTGCLAEPESNKVWKIEWYLEEGTLKGDLILQADSSALLITEASELLNDNQPVWYDIKKKNDHFLFIRKDEQIALRFDILKKENALYTCIFADEVIVKIQQ